jgi:hypothetical protein
MFFLKQQWKCSCIWKEATLWCEDSILYLSPRLYWSPSMEWGNSYAIIGYFLNNILYQLSDSGSCEPLVVFILPNPIILNVPLIVRIVPLIVHNIYIFFYRFICLMGGNWCLVKMYPRECHISHWPSNLLWWYIIISHMIYNFL